jgi:glutamate decarboxylase
MHRIRRDAEYESATLAPTYAQRWFAHQVPAHTIPTESMPPDAALQLVRDELALDGNPKLNLASFVTTWMEPQADALAAEVLDKNLVDKDEYPQTEVIHRRVVNMTGRLLNAPTEDSPVGTATVGSSEAIMLGLLAHARTWKRRREAENKPVDKPNVIMSACVHTCWEKACRYFDLEPKVVPVREGRYTLRPEDVASRVDENTVAVGAILGNTFTGGLDDIAGISAVLDEICEREGWDVPIHVDAASGGFVAAFAVPDHAWDFRVPRVRSINVSNHKFGLVYPGMGTVVFRDESCVPDELVFHITYLGGDAPTYSLNFSQPSMGVLLQYFMFLRLGREGYRRVMETVLGNARHLERGLAEIGFDLLDADSFMPVIAIRPGNGKVDLYELSDRLRERGWIVPAYAMPKDAQDIDVLRLVVRESFGRDLSDVLVADLKTTMAKLAGKKVRPSRAKPHHPIC